MKLAIQLFAVVQALKFMARRHAAFRERLKEKDMVVQLKLQDDSLGRYIEFRKGKILSRGRLHPAPDVVIFFRSAEIASKFFSPKPDFLFNIDAMKNFKMGMIGPEDLTSWLMETISMAQTVGWTFGEDAGNGIRRLTNNSNGGPLNVYVKDGKILRMTPIEFGAEDSPPWTITARGRSFTPVHQTSAAPYALASKSLIYSKDRLLYPMKRVDWDPEGARNTQNRGISGYERISWDEALDLVASEFMRVKRDFGPGAIALSHGSHHTWGNIGYYLSSLYRFFNLVGYTKVVHNPDSWEGWYWGAAHHWGSSMRLGGGEMFGQVEDALKECEMMVFWSADPEATSGVYAGFEGTIRRLWAKELGIKFVHIDPYYNHTAALLGGKWMAPRPGTDPALAQAICQVWISEGLYDRKFVETRTTGFEEWAEYIMGVKDGTPKSPEWASAETGVPARDIVALAREWAKRKTYLGAGGFGNCLGGACRTATGAQWARMMVILMAMQGLGRPGVNFGNLQVGTPIDFSFWFPGYAEGGISGDLMNTGNAPNTYQRIPHVLTMNSSKQMIPRLQLPEAILEGSAQGFLTDPTSTHGQFLPFMYPAPGHSKVQILYKYGGASLGTMNNTNRWVKMYQSENLPTVISQSIWMEGEAQFADIILPACTNFERYDIGEWGHAGGYGGHFFAQNNHRVVVMQHKCIEPLGESRSDYQIYVDLAQRMGLSAIFTEGMTELDWCKRIFEGSDISQYISWNKFLKKGYFVVPTPEEKLRAPTSYKWFYEDRKKDVPEPYPLPSDYSGTWLEGLQTQSGRLEFIPESLKKLNDPERPALNSYIPSWEGTHTTELLRRFPIQLLTAHSRYSFHSLGDGKDSTINDIEDHRKLIDGYYYLECRISREDAAKRNIRQNDLVRLYNDRGSVICAATISRRLPPGVMHTYQASAVYDAVGKPGASSDRGGCVNLLTNHRSQTSRTSSMGPNACLIEVERWDKGAEPGAEPTKAKFGAALA
ncbi:MAG: molybdopterin-dependent oxidoreductase [Alphaproteobacteria bacterium]|nr:molybdopterin-dependent oxidoreductase [Alphaproteobacteria bacterium]